MGGTSGSFRGAGRLGRFGGGERSRGETGHRGDSLRCSALMGDLKGPEATRVPSVTRGPNLGVDPADILPADEAVCAVAFDIRVGLVSDGLDFRSFGGTAGAEEALWEWERASGLSGEGSREVKGEDGAVDV